MEASEYVIAGGGGSAGRVLAARAALPFDDIDDFALAAPNPDPDSPQSIRRSHAATATKLRML